MATIGPKTFTARTGQGCIVCSAQPEDAAALLACIRPVAEETEFFVLEPDEFPANAEEERKWIQDHLGSPG